MDLDELIPGLPFTIEELAEAVVDGQVTVRPHPTEDLYIYNYSPTVQYSRNWTDITKTCRGLILDGDYNVVARPFPKLFNYTEIVPDPVIFERAPTVVQDKADGSLGIIYPVSTVNGYTKYAVATRGSFESEQAIWATNWLDFAFTKKDWGGSLPYDQPWSVTTLVEIIYPDNRICVNYGERAELVLIAAIDNATGADIPIQEITWWKGARVDEHLGIKDIDEAYRLATSNEYEEDEGVVCTWYKYDEPSFRFKVKHPEYVRLHGIIHNFSKKKVWESLSNGEDFLTLLTDVPDEFYSQVKEVVSDLKSAYIDIEDRAIASFQNAQWEPSKKHFAQAVKNHELKSILFRMYENKPYDDIIWKMLKPKGE